MNVGKAARICQVSLERHIQGRFRTIQYSDRSTAHVHLGHGPATSAQGQSDRAAYLNEEQRLQLEHCPAN